MTKHIKGMCLSAGFATRLRPLTSDRPKAAIPFFGLPSLYYALFRLQKAGISQLAVNSHYQAPMIKQLLLGVRGGISVEYSFEKEILGSAGALIPIKAWLGSDDLLLYNPDVICDLNLHRMIEFHKTHRPLATVAISTKAPANKKPSVWLEPQSEKVNQISLHHQSGKTPYFGTGIFLISAPLLNYLQQKTPSNLQDLLNDALLREETILGFKHDGYFRDLGDSPKDLYESHAELFDDQFKRPFERVGAGDFLSHYDRSLEILYTQDGEISVRDNLSSGWDFKSIKTLKSFYFNGVHVAKNAQVSCSLLQGKLEINAHDALSQTLMLDQHRLDIV